MIRHNLRNSIDTSRVRIGKPGRKRQHGLPRWRWAAAWSSQPVSSAPACAMSSSSSPSSLVSLDAKDLLIRRIVAERLWACVLRKEESGDRKYDSCSAWSRFEVGE